MIAHVPQDVYLFNTPVRESIRIGRGGATDADVKSAARRALAIKFLEVLPGSWDAVPGERGCTLSGGQRQRVAIARALLEDAPILVMDGAVSNLGTESEAALRPATREASAGRTTLMIAHRPSTVREADRLVVLEHGRVAENGTFQESTAGDTGVFSRMLRAGLDP